MKRIHPVLSVAAALAVASGVAVLPTLASAPPASAQASCNGTSLLYDRYNLGQVRVPTLGDGTGNTNCELGLGNAGPAVTRLQIALHYCNLQDPLSIDGQYGPITQEAVIDDQQYWGVAQDGVFGPQTSKAMTWPVAGSNYTECSWWSAG